MTPKEFEKRMKDIYDRHLGDKEVYHGLADTLLCQALIEQGYSDGVAWFEEMDKWYA